MAPFSPFDPIVCVVDFHHARGPEVETWIGVKEGEDPGAENDWSSILPFLALADGAHSSTEDFSYFTLRLKKTDERPASSLFGVACTRQIDSNALINRPADVTRSTKQKAVVAICDSPQYFGQLKEKLSIITQAWFAQRDFTDITVLQDFQESLAKSFRDQEDEKDQFFGLGLRELIHEYKYQVLVLFKCLLLQPKMLFFGTHCERMCMIQFSLISLIPCLIRHLEDCADPAFNAYEENLVMPTSLKTSERASLLSYVGLPLQIFGKGSLFGPYTPLQQLDVLADHDTKSYVVGSTNSLLLDQKDRYSDIFVNLDDNTISFTSQQLRAALTLTTPDRRWIDFLTKTVEDTWDEANPGRPNTLGYAGSEEFIRLQFEEYLLALLSAVKYRLYVEKHKDDPKALLHEVDGDPANEFGNEWVKAWMQTESFRVFNKFTDSHIFDIVEPNHPCTGGLTIEDVQRRLATQVAELHLDERFNSGREVIGKHLATGQARVSEAFNTLWADIEKKREEQRRRAAERKALEGPEGSEKHSETNGKAHHGKGYPKAPDLTQAQAAASAAAQKAGAYFSSWGTWASEKRKQGWGRTASGTTQIDKDSSLKRLSLVDKARSEKDGSLPSTPSTIGSDLKERPVSVEKRKSTEKRTSATVWSADREEASAAATTSPPVAKAVPAVVPDSKSEQPVTTVDAEAKTSQPTTEGNGAAKG